jgi:S1-C subfamily serine protease
MHKTIATLLLLVTASVLATGQKAKPTESQSIPIATQTLLDGVKNPASKGVIRSVLMIQCPKDKGKGTGFVLSSGGIITTNSHVVGSCNAEDLVAISSVSTEPVKFASMEKDPNRDLALLCATKPLPPGLELKGDENPPVETEVETWGYPLRYQEPAPVLSRGYVAGYTMGKEPNGQLKNPPVRHLIVNGALNPGNSGGPLIDRSSGKVIGIVVEKWTLWSPNIEVAIQGFSHPRSQLAGNFSQTDAQGHEIGISEQQMMGIVLKEFYDASQVMVGEAISVSELNAFIAEKRQALGCAVR